MENRKIDREQLNNDIQLYWMNDDIDLRDLYGLSDDQMSIIAQAEDGYNQIETDEEGPTPEQEESLHQYTEEVIDRLGVL
jgi:hypothetical protein